MLFFIALISIFFCYFSLKRIEQTATLEKVMTVIIIIQTRDLYTFGRSMCKFAVAQINTYVRYVTAVYFKEHQIAFFQVVLFNRANHAKDIARVTLYAQVEYFTVQLFRKS